MGGQHGHRSTTGSTGATGSGTSSGLRVGHRARVVLICLVVVLGLSTAAGLVVLWPTGVPKSPAGAGSGGQQTLDAAVTAVKEDTCPGLSDDRLADGTLPKTVRCATVRVRLAEGSDQGQEAAFQVTGQVLQVGIHPGDDVTVVHLPAEAGAGAHAYAFSDFARRLPLEILLGLFVVVVLAVGRLRGLGALVGLGLGGATVFAFMLPALRLGENPAMVGLVGCVGIMTVILYVAHGVSAKTTTALLGTVAGLAVTTALASWAADAGHLDGLNGEQSLTLTQVLGQRVLSGVIVCGLIIAGLGVLNDVTVTQASAVWELREHAAQLGPAALFASGMRIGRDHLSSTIYTITFAYAGAALPLLVLIEAYQRPLSQVLSSSQIAEELVRTLVGAIGLVLAIPLTTAIAVVVTMGSQAPHAHHEHRPEAAHTEPDDVPPRTDVTVSARPSVFGDFRSSRHADDSGDSWL